MAYQTVDPNTNTLEKTYANTTPAQISEMLTAGHAFTSSSVILTLQRVVQHYMRLLLISATMPMKWRLLLPKKWVSGSKRR